ncbi:hypothetical protein BBK36DRAFT_1126844 [Trichoderma citrinoviride]|uniref:F-box domain-containing protein n=1 Tax=Trichoderma citrinoviride TaxID=58853 RepID=A0A2T4B292_9HYPO|nr:hypothetical protein BBK36DRAFT_1126844 [Trichoderma citrinoviride]PTB63439.1 hypothetical protein BBK36DRAFT_1126844 [Trichoderma citrinoviride]
MKLPFAEPTFPPTPPRSPIQWTGRFSAPIISHVSDEPKRSIDHLPPEIICMVMGNLTSRFDLRNLGASSFYLAAVLNQHRISILKTMLGKMLDPSNLDICLLTMGILQVSRKGDEVWQCLWALSQRPTLDAIHDAETLCSMLDLTLYIEYMLTIYTYPKHPDGFWRRALRKYANRWPEGNVPDGFVSINSKTKEELQQVASRLWNVRDAALGNSPDAEPRAEHSAELMTLFQREMFSAELKLRCDLVAQLGHSVPEWMCEEAPGDGVQSFLELLVHAMARCWNRDDGEVWTEMNRSSWAEGRALGIRFYICLAMFMPHSASADDVDEICTAIESFMSYYRTPDIWGEAYQWFFEFHDAAWDGLWKHTLEFCRQLDDGLVDDINGGTDYF